MRINQPVILIVDDDPDDVEMITEILVIYDRDMRVVHMNNGKEALSYLDTALELPRLVVLDMNMPILDGRGTLAELKKQDALRGIPVVVLTTSTNDVDKEYCNGFTVEILTKPRNIQQLHETVQELLKVCQD